tara:strand:- start:1105 stop:2079 length:975 start_codon:yes stop_codon:yes gene_type:complete
MAYIGKQPVVGNFQVLDAISVVNGQAAYTMQVASTDISPQSANHMLVSLNGVLQKPGSSYTVSGATITFASNLVTNDVIDFIQVLGDVLNTGTPSDGAVLTAGLAANAVTGAKLNTDVISAQTALAAEPADTDEFLVSDAGVLKRIDYSLIKGGGSLVLLSTATVSSGVANVDIDSDIDGTFKNYIVEITNMHIATDDQEFRMQFFQGGSVDTGSVYDYAFQRVQNNSQNVYTNSSNVAQIQLNAAHDNLNEACLNGRVYIANPASTTFNTHVKYDLNYQIDGDNIAMIDGIGRIEQTAAVDGVRFFMASGNIDAGIFKLYGIT